MTNNLAFKSYKINGESLMRLLSIILIIMGIVFTIFGYLIYFKKNYKLINGFKNDLAKGEKNISYGKKSA